MLSASPGDGLGSALDYGQEQAIRDYLADQIDTAYLQQGVSDLQLIEVEYDTVGTSILFQQIMRGLPVRGSYVTVYQGHNGEIMDTDDRAHVSLDTPTSMVPSIGFAVADRIANVEYADPNQYKTSGELVWFSIGKSGHLAWQVETIVENIDNEDIEFTTIVDAHSGDVLSQVQSPTMVNESLNSQETETGVFPRIVINNTIGASGSRDYAAPFDDVVELTLGCTGTLIASNVVLSARHCGAGAGSTINFGDNGNNPTFAATVQSSFLPDGSGSLLDGGDVAILTLTGNVPANVATPRGLIDATTELVGQVASLHGYGYNGLGSSGHGTTADGWRWGGENIIDVYGSPASASGTNIISTDFDNGNGSANTIGSSSPTPLQYEATTAPGDSGGPVLVQSAGEWCIAGVLSGGTTNDSTYGDISWWTGTAIYRSDIEARGGTFCSTGPSVSIGESGGGTTVEEGGAADSYTIALSDPTTGSVQITATADAETELSLDGSTYSSSVIVTLDNTDPGTIYVRAVDDSDEEGAHSSAISHQITSTTDPTNYPLSLSIPNVNVAVIDDDLTSPVLFGVDFDTAGSPSPTNWLQISGGSNATFGNLADESGAPSSIDLTINETPQGNWSAFGVAPVGNTIPIHANSLANIGGQVYTDADPLLLTYSDLDPLADYEIYVMAAEGFYSSIQQRVTIAGDGPAVTFNQTFVQNQLFINDQLGDNTRKLTEYAKVITADSNGQIVINVDPLGGTQDVVLAGVAIYPVPPTVVDGDFDDNTLYDCADIDALVAVIASGTNDLSYDLTGDNAVDDADLSAWLAEAGAVNLASGNSYLYGDANLDGSVDMLDLNVWAANRFTATTEWCSGNFNADATIDFLDFNLWSANRFMSAIPQVPAPKGRTTFEAKLMQKPMLGTVVTQQVADEARDLVARHEVRTADTSALMPVRVVRNSMMPEANWPESANGVGQTRPIQAIDQALRELTQSTS